jgi:SAM-dependent methyltransferase
MKAHSRIFSFSRKWPISSNCNVAIHTKKRLLTIRRITTGEAVMRNLRISMDNSAAVQSKPGGEMNSKRTTRGLFCSPDLKELYSKKYDEKMQQWRTLGAINKARNIECMVESVRSDIDSVLEVGCGTGAVLAQVAARKIGTRFTGIEIGTERSQQQNDGDLFIRGYDGETIPYEERSFDLVYATHVLEHVLDERGFLSEVRRVSRRYIYIEVPCELHLRTTRRALQTSLDIGHINAYTPDSFALQLETSGLVVKKLKVFAHSYAMHRFSSPAWRAMLKTALRSGLLRVSESIASKVFTYHCGVLCEPGPLLSI